MAKGPPSPVDAALDRVRAICTALPGGEEKLSHGAPSFHVRGKMFTIFVDDHHEDGRLAVWCKATHDEQRALVASDPAQYYVPPYVGVKGWVGVRLDLPTTDWIKLTMLVEQGWTDVAPKSIASGKRLPPPRKPAPPPVRKTTDPARARVALEKVTALALALPEATCERHARHATYRVRKKTFAYFLDNHHGDGFIGACVKTAPGQNDRLVRSEPKRFYRPQYIGARGWVGVRVDMARVDWKDVAERVAASYRAVAPKGLAALVRPAERR
ncbi:MAG TPA: MmcQ/YjbR family DNA-binding protein [Polyangiaceae bacterium]|jgi:hypothetical protein